MNLDAKIALEVIKHFVKQDKPILDVHDSFIVQAQYRDELFQVMQKVYQQKTGGFSIPIKWKNLGFLFNKINKVTSKHIS